MKFTEVIPDAVRKKKGWSRHDARLYAEARLVKRLKDAGLDGKYERVLSRYDLETKEVVAFVAGFAVKPKLVED